MKTSITATALGILLAVTTPAFAEKMNCDLINGTAEEGSDEWTAVLDLKANTVELHSLYSIFGENPFAVLTLAPRSIAKQYDDGMIVFSGKNQTHPKDKYVFIYDPKTKSGSFEANESNGTRWFGEGSCFPAQQPKARANACNLTN